MNVYKYMQTIHIKYMIEGPYNYKRIFSNILKNIPKV